MSSLLKDLDVPYTAADASVVAILENAYKLLKSRFYDRATVEFNKALDADRKLAAKVVTALYRQMESSGDVEGMLALGVNVLSHDPGNVELANVLGNAYRRQGNVNQARNLYRHCLKHDPQFRNAAYNLAAMLAQVPLFDGSAVSAIAEFENLKNFKYPEPEAEVIENLVAQVRPSETEDGEGGGDASPDAEQPTDEAVEQMGEALTDPKAPEAEGEEESDEPHPMDLLGYIEATMEPGHPDEHHSLLNLAFNCLNQEEGRVAQIIFEKLLERDSENPDLVCFRIIAVALQGEIDSAEEQLNTFLKQHPNHRYANVNYGMLLRRLRKGAQARIYFFIAYKLLERTKGEYDFAKVLEEAERFEEKEATRKALELYEPILEELDDPARINRIAEMFRTFNRPRNAQHAYKLTLKLDRRNTDAMKGLKEIRDGYLSELDKALRADQTAKAAELMNYALEITPSNELIARGIELFESMDNKRRVRELKELRDSLEAKATRRQVQAKLLQAQDFEAKRNYKAAIKAYEKAIRIEPRREVYKHMVALCERIQRPDLVEKISEWFNQKEGERERQRREAKL